MDVSHNFVINNGILRIISLSILFLSQRNISKRNDKNLRFADLNIIYASAIAVFFMGVLCLGIAAIFGSLEYLFDISINRTYMTDIVWIAMGIG